MGTKHQPSDGLPEQLSFGWEERGCVGHGSGSEAVSGTAGQVVEQVSSAEERIRALKQDQLMDRVAEEANLIEALRRVCANKGSAGVDGMEELRDAGKSLAEVIEQLNQKFSGWIQYFRMARMKRLMQDIGQWLRRRVRCLRLKQCKRAHAIARFLMSLGESKDSAYKLGGSGKGWWRLADTPQANRAMGLRWFKETGLLDPEAVYLAVRKAC